MNWNLRIKKSTETKESEQRTRTVVVRAISRHRFDELMVKLATSIRSNVDCGLRSVVKILKLVNEAFGGILGDKLPSHTTISDWMQKNGMSTYMEAGMGLSAGDYCEILDESITVGSQKLILTLGQPQPRRGILLVIQT